MFCKIRSDEQLLHTKSTYTPYILCNSRHTDNNHHYSLHTIRSHINYIKGPFFTNRDQRRHLHYSEISVCVLCGLIPNILRIRFGVFPNLVGQLFKCLTACQLIKNLLCYSQGNVTKTTYKIYTIFTNYINRHRLKPLDGRIQEGVPCVAGRMPGIVVSPALRFHGLYSLRRHRLTGIGIPIINLRRSDDRLRFIMGIPILIRRRLLSE